jgi:hypothetical protein
MAASHDRRIARELAARCSAALQILLEAYTHARNRYANVWNFAAPLAHLQEAGLAKEDLHWLVRSGYLQQKTETTAHGDRRATRGDKRRHRRKKICVVLTEKGARWLGKLRKGLGHQRPVRPKTPTYDPDERELRVGVLVLKRFRQPAPRQEPILHRFQERGWRGLIDDPQPPRPGINRKKRLHETIHNLNRYQTYPLIHFFGDGSGRRLGWEWTR